ncbi:amidase [Candidatus Poribacteria bacterium]|nr:amidase [Candidatus Poribacteria bacterium]MBT5534072.1 amidase [Candidatus Poribacteria bacterium]MBT5711558.1 amidase [Candidatus Poribacteria bacterium]
MIAAAEEIAGLRFTDGERELMLKAVNARVDAFATMRGADLPNSVPPSASFHPAPHAVATSTDEAARLSDASGTVRPTSDEDLAFLPVRALAELVRTRAVTSRELTSVYLDRLRRHGPGLECVVTLLEDDAMRDAARADEEIVGGHYRGPLHGIPWGAKDLLATKGHRTTWGAEPYRDQVTETDATVVTRLRDAGAVLVAKLTLGALAYGDVWYGGRTRNPWDIEAGSSGSSAGSAAATAAGLVAFAIGTETWGSIISPATTCGVTGLRPTFGRVSRHGAMALSWSMDKIGPICRSVEDCAIVLDAIHGPDGLDETVADAAFPWDAGVDAAGLRVGYVAEAFEEGHGDDAAWDRADQEVLAQLRGLGVDLQPIELPKMDVGPLSVILNVEAAAAFDELTRSDADDRMVRQTEHAWPNIFRHTRLVPAVEYVQATRLRTLVMRQMAETMADLDAYVVPTFVGKNSLLTNLTGHPAVCVPNGFRENGTPTSIEFIGALYGEANLLALARAYQRATSHHMERPPVGG